MTEPVPSTSTISTTCSVRPVPARSIADRTAEPGVATGLAVTGAGGDVLFVEASVMDGEPGLTLTGQLGDVMQESGEIARSYLRAHAAELGLSGLDRRLHVHFPAGAVPKDGPSAGITMTTALASLLSGRQVRPEVAMTGEVTLQGRVLPIGGVKQKVLAAHRAGLTEVILPDANGPDLDDVPQSVRDRTHGAPGRRCPRGPGARARAPPTEFAGLTRDQRAIVTAISSWKTGGS